MSNYGGPTYHEIMAQRDAALKKDDPEETQRRVREAIERHQTGSSTSVQTTTAPYTQPMHPEIARLLQPRGVDPLYVGDVPGGVRPPVETQPAPEGTDPYLDKLLDLGDKMVVWMVWVIDDQDPDRVPWLAGSRDDPTIQADPEGWADAIEEVREEYGNDILITRTTVNYGRVKAAFEPVEI